MGGKREHYITEKTMYNKQSRERRSIFGVALVLVQNYVLGLIGHVLGWAYLIKTSASS